MEIRFSEFSIRRAICNELSSFHWAVRSGADYPERNMILKFFISIWDLQIQVPFTDWISVMVTTAYFFIRTQSSIRTIMKSSKFSIPARMEQGFQCLWQSAKIQI